MRNRAECDGGVVSVSCGVEVVEGGLFESENNPGQSTQLRRRKRHFRKICGGKDDFSVLIN